MPISRMPLRVTRREESDANWFGAQRSTAMLASTEGPPRKPVLAATNSSAPSNTSTSMSSAWLVEPPKPRLAMMSPNTTALSVCPVCDGCTSQSRYSRMMPPAVMLRDSAIRNMVHLPVRTRGSLSMLTLFDTASMPV